MGAFRNITIGILATTVLTSSLTPAMADWGHGGGWDHGGGWNHERHEHHDNTGAIVAGVVGVGILAAIIASASSNSHKNENRYQGQGYPPAPIVQNYPQQNYYAPQSGQINSEGDAVDACVRSAENQAGQGARVNQISDVQRDDNGWDVHGVINAYNNANESYRSYGSQGANLHNFSCKVRYGTIKKVQIDSELAYNY